MNDRIMDLIIRASENSDKDAWNELRLIYYEDLFVLALQITHCVSAARDSVQNCLKYAENHFDELQNPVDFEIWIRKLIRTEAEKHCDQSKEKVYVPSDIYVESHVTTDSMLELKIPPEERQKIVNKSLDCLNDAEETVMLLYAYDDRSIDEIANDMNLTEEETKHLLASAENKVRKYICQNEINTEFGVDALTLFLILLTNLHPEKVIQPVIPAMKITGIASDGYQKAAIADKVKDNTKNNILRKITQKTVNNSMGRKPLLTNILKVTVAGAATVGIITGVVQHGKSNSDGTTSQEILVNIEFGGKKLNLERGPDQLQKSFPMEVEQLSDDNYPTYVYSNDGDSLYLKNGESGSIEHVELTFSDTGDSSVNGLTRSSDRKETLKKLGNPNYRSKKDEPDYLIYLVNSPVLECIGFYYDEDKLDFIVMYTHKFDERS